MAVLGRLLLGSAERLDLPDLLSVDSYTAADFKYLIQSFAGGDKPYILKGFDVIQPQDAIGTESISIRVSDSVVYYPASKAGAFYYGLPEGNASSEALIPELRKNATNFVYLTFSTSDGAKDSRAFWDPDQNGGDGGEFSQDVNTESVLSVVVNVSVSAFPEDTIPICKVTVGASVIESVQDCRDMMFRLGTGGVAPDPFADYDFRDEPSSTYARQEPNGTMTSALDPNPFQGGDKNIQSLKEWMDAVMTRLKEIGGTTYWYQAPSGSNTPSVANVFLDALGSTIKSKGKWVHDGSTAGEVQFTEDLHYTSVKDTRLSIIRASTLNIPDDQVAWINLVRDKETNNSHASITWQNGSAAVNGVTGAFGNLAKGDWIKKKTDTDDKYLRVEEFYASSTFGGGTTTAALAQSIRLSGTYAGATGPEIGVYTKGEYLTADIQVSARNSTSIQTAGGNFLWLAYRSDTVLGITGIVPTQLTLTFSEGDGTRIKVTSTGGPHGLVDNDQITVTTGPHQGTYKVEVESSTVFYIETAITNSAVGSTAFYAIVTTAARNTAYSFNLESANHGFASNETISIADTSTAYDGSYSINVRSATSFQIPISSLIPNPGAMSGNIVRLAKVNVRTEFNAVKLVQGESIDIGDGETENIRAFIGMESLAQNRPVYKITPGYNTIDGHQNYNADPNDDLTQRASKLTSMMADRVQDRGIEVMPSQDLRRVTNVTNVNQQEITFDVAGSTITLTTPGSDASAVVTLPSVAPGISLGLGQVAYVDISRNATSTPSINVVDAINFVLDENSFIIATRDLTNDVVLWDGSIVPPGTQQFNTNINRVIRQNQMLQVIEGGTWLWDLTTETLSWDATAYVQVPGMPDNANQISADSIVLAANQVAYVDINRYMVAFSPLPVTVVDSDSLVLITDRIIIARRDGNDVVIASHHNQYVRLNGRSGGQRIYGGTDAGDDLILNSTLSGTKGQVIVEDTTASTSTSTGALRVDGGVGVAGSIWAGSQVVAGSTLRSQSGVYWEKQDIVTGSVALTVDNHLVLIDTTSAVADITITLPASNASNKGQVIIVKDIAGFIGMLNKQVILATTGGDLILSGEPTPLRMDISWSSLTLVASGAGSWYVI